MAWQLPLSGPVVTLALDDTAPAVKRKHEDMTIGQLEALIPRDIDEDDGDDAAEMAANPN